MTTNKQYVFGIHSVLALLDKHAERVYRLLIQAERHDKKIETIKSIANKNNIPIEKISRDELNHLTDGANHQGVVAMCSIEQSYSERDLGDFLQKINAPAFLLILDGVQDPHNLGACFRSADAAGVHAIIVPKDKSVGITPIVTKVASGATESVAFFQVTNLVRTISSLKEIGIWIYGAAEEGSESIYKMQFSGPVAIVLGAEGVGLRRLTKETCDMLVNIPMQGSVSSLNVSVATGIFLFEVVRQRLIRS